MRAVTVTSDISVLRAARTLGVECGWSLSKMAMHKTLYVAQMLHLGRTGRPVFIEAFEAWAYGPVVRELARATSRFKKDPVPDIFPVAVFESGTSEAHAVRDAYLMTKHMTAGQLVNYTHRAGGAWEAHYREGYVGTVIPMLAILQEWKTSTQPSDAALAWANEMANEVEASPSRYLDHQDERAFRARLRGADCQ